MKKRICEKVRRELKDEFSYYLGIGSHTPAIASYYGEADRERWSKEERRSLREKAYRETLPELKACFAELLADWESRMSGEKPDLSTNRDAAARVTALILFLTRIGEGNQ
jgi:hypothetical protein